MKEFFCLVILFNVLLVSRVAHAREGDVTGTGSYADVGRQLEAAEHQADKTAEGSNSNTEGGSNNRDEGNRNGETEEKEGQDVEGEKKEEKEKKEEGYTGKLGHTDDEHKGQPQSTTSATTTETGTETNQVETENTRETEKDHDQNGVKDDEHVEEERENKEIKDEDDSEKQAHTEDEHKDQPSQSQTSPTTIETGMDTSHAEDGKSKKSPSGTADNTDPNKGSSTGWLGKARNRASQAIGSFFVRRKHNNNTQ